MKSRFVFLLFVFTVCILSGCGAGHNARMDVDFSASDAAQTAESGAVVTEFLKCHPEFEPYDLPETEGISHTVNEPKFMRTMMPMDHGGDGFFAAAMRRKTETGKETKR